MKMFVVLLALCAMLKVGVKEWLYRSAADDVIVSAYRTRAADACTKSEQSRKAGIADKIWSERAHAVLNIGNANIPVMIWQTDNELWVKRFRDPYLTLTLDKSSGAARCEFDIVTGTATVKSL